MPESVIAGSYGNHLSINVGYGFVINSFDYVDICSVYINFDKSFFYHEWILHKNIYIYTHI